MKESNNKLLKKIVKQYIIEDDDLYIKQLDHRIEQLNKHKEQIDSHIDHLKHSLELYKEKKQKIIDEIARLRLEKQTRKLQNKGIV